MSAQAENRNIEAEPGKQAGAQFGSLTQLILEMVRPYRKWLLLIFLAMILETAMSLAVPWPLKIIIDNVIAARDLPGWLGWVHALLPNREAMTLAASCAVALVVFTAIEGIAGYVDSYLTESVAQNMANDMRRRIYHHLQKLSLAYYDKHQVAKLLSTITTDVSTIQDFVSSTLLSILVDLLTILGMFGLMVYLKWDFALVAVGMAPFLLLFDSGKKSKKPLMK
jgi:subfamily B ATP-binding cassette protein MsbA